MAMDLGLDQGLMVVTRYCIQRPLRILAIFLLSSFMGSLLDHAALVPSRNKNYFNLFLAPEQSYKTIYMDW